MPHVKVVNIPPGLDQREGGEAVVGYLQGAFTAFGYGAKGS